MKKILSKWFIVLAIFIIRVTYSQSNVKVWIETTVQDFSDNQLTNVVVTNNSGGEVQLPHPLKITVQDHRDDSVFRFISKDSAGNYVGAWIQDGNIFVKKYSSSGNELTGAIQVNDVNASLTSYSIYRTALFNDGTCIVIWNTKNLYGQIFGNALTKIGSNFPINDIEVYIPDRLPTVIANENDRTFWILCSNEESKIYVHKIDKSGNISVGDFQLDKGISMQEYNPTAIYGSSGLYVTWNAMAAYKVNNTYLCKFDNNGTHINSPIVLNDFGNSNPYGSSDLCLDKHGNLFAVWEDSRNTDVDVWRQNIYGQFFDSTGSRIGGNFRIDNGIFNTNNFPDIEYNRNEFQLSWKVWDTLESKNHIYTNKWELQPQLCGEMVSSVFFVGPDGCNFDKIFWERSLYQLTNVKFKLRTGETIEQLNSSFWYGPIDTATCYENNGGEKINAIHNGDRYVQYKAFLTSENVFSPILNSVSISYTTLDSAPPSPPLNLIANSNHSHLTLSWQPNTEDDLMEYILYRGIESKKYESNWKMILQKGTLNVEDTSARIGTVYYYVITAVDSNRNQSNYSNEVSGVAFGINVYVSANGSSSGDGSINNPFKTIQQGINAAIFGDTIRVLPGTYKESFTMKNGVSLVGINAEQCKITVSITASNNCVIKGFTITNSLGCSSVSPIITENIFRGPSALYLGAINLTNNSSPIISKNFVTECGIGISMDGSGCKPLVTNNIIKANSVGMTISISDKPSIINNTIITQGSSVFDLRSFDSVTVENNILVTANPSSYLFSSSYKIIYNDFWCSNQSSIEIGETNISLDPKFVSMDLQDYHLLLSSPCINSGNPDPAYNDADGSRNDMGAYGGSDPIQTGLSSQLTKSIYVSSLSAYPKDTISVFIGIDNSAGLAKADFSLEYDGSLLEYIRSKFTQTIQNFTLQTRIVSANEVSFSLSSNIAMQTGTKDILEIRFVVDPNSKTNDASPLTLKNVSLFDANMREIIIRSITDGAFVINFTNESENYVYVDGKNIVSGDGSKRYPYNDIVQALNNASEGDSIFVASGDYYGTIVIYEGIHLIGSGASVTNIILTGDEEIILGNKAEICGFTIKADDRHSPQPLISCQSSSPIIKKNRFESAILAGAIAIAFSENSNATVEHNYIKQMYIDIYNSNPILKNNILEGCFPIGTINCRNGAAPLIIDNIIYGFFGAATITINDANPFLRNNLIYCDDRGWGISINNADSTKIYNNIIKDRSQSGAGIQIINSSRIEIVNNSIITQSKGIDEQNSESTVFNNIIINNNQFGVQFSSSSQYNYNDIWNNLVNYNGVNPGSNDISVDPLFVDTAKCNYQLAVNSPCIDTGNPDQKYNDLDGTRNDIGAYGGPSADFNWLQVNSSSLAIDSVSAASSDTVKVTIRGEKISGAIEVELGLTFDPSLLKIVNAKVGDLTRSFTLEKTNNGSGSVVFYLKSTRSINYKEGEIIQLFFAVNANHLENTTLNFESARIKDEATYITNIIDLKDGHINITSTGVRNVDNTIPNTFKLHQNYPNPFNPVTKILYEIPSENKVSIKIFDILGREIVTLVEEYQKPGRYEIEWNAKGYASGVYFYSIKARDFCCTKKLVLLR